MAQDTYQRARENYQDAVDAASEERARMVEDLRFSNPANPRQWDEYRSSASIAYDTALDIGLGWMRVLPVVKIRLARKSSGSC